MSALFGIIGLLSLITGFVMFVIALIRKNPKKQSGIIMLSGLVLFIVGVSLPSSEDIIEKGEKVTGVSASSNESENDTETNDEGKENMENVKNGPLIEIGQWAEEDDGTKVTLKKITTLEETLDLHPIKMTIHDVKLLERSGGTQDDNVIQVSYTVENVSEKEIMFRAISVITTNTKRQIDVALDNMSRDAGSTELYGEVVEEGIIIVPYPEDSFDELTSIKLITGDVWDNNKPDKFHESVTKEILFE